jgi:NADPH-dependent curcumin reductase CurA
MNRQIILKRRPSGIPREEDFEHSTVPVPKIAHGQVLLRNLFLSLDPGIRRRMDGGHSYAAPIQLGDVIVGGTVSRVQESQNAQYSEGEYVLAGGGWQDYSVSNGTGLRKLDPARAPLSTALGILGMPGFTAYYGITRIGLPKIGETVAVSAAAGSVGSLACQIAKIHGARVVGIAGSQEKMSYLCDSLKIDAAVSHRSKDLAGDLAKASPTGIDVYFDNVGGDVLEAVLPLLNTGARIPLCGRIAHYNETNPPPGPNRVPQLLGAILTRRVTMRGFIIHDHLNLEEEFLTTAGQWLRERKIQYREHVTDGLENAPKALAGLFRGENIGKSLIRVSG